MKHTFIYLILLLFLRIVSFGQSCIPPCGPVPLVFDISTGVDNNGQLIPVLPADDNWQVRPAPTSANPNPIYQPALCSNNKFENYKLYTSIYEICSPKTVHDTDCAFIFMPATGSNVTGFNSYFDVQLSKSVRWLAPKLCPIGHIEEHCSFTNTCCNSNNITNCSEWLYKGVFNIPQHCGQQSVTLNFNALGASSVIDLIMVNGYSYPLSSIINTVYIAPNFIKGTLNIPISQFNLSITGQLEIIIRSQLSSSIINSIRYYPTIIIDGDITIKTSAFVDFKLYDKNNIKKREFCIGEDVFIDGSKISTGSYYMDLWEVNGNNATFITKHGISGWVDGNPAWVNVTDAFETGPNPVMFQTGKTYRVKLAINSPCGLIETTKDFNYVCCDNSLDGSFSISLANGGTQLIGKSAAKGTHKWDVYWSQNVGKGPYTPMATFTNGAQFNLPLAIPELPCYYVTHKHSNECGNLCESQSVCNAQCDELPCLASAPQEVSYYSHGDELSWKPVQGATSYVVQVIKNGCCGGEVHSESQVRTISTPGIPNPVSGGYWLTLPSLMATLWNTTAPDVDDGGGFANCYSIIVYAICSNGSASLGSVPFCFTIN